jgi:hypothetical protein
MILLSNRQSRGKKTQNRPASPIGAKLHIPQQLQESDQSNANRSHSEKILPVPNKSIKYQLLSDCRGNIVRYFNWWLLTLKLYFRSLVFQLCL